MTFAVPSGISADVHAVDVKTAAAAGGVPVVGLLMVC